MRYDPSRRQFVIGGAAALLLVGCGSMDSPSEPFDEGAGFPRTVAHGLGETAIPAKPTRIVASADRDQLDVLLAMGLTPVLYGVSGDYEPAAPWVDADDLADVDSAPMPGAFEPNLELIAAARPDLILDAWSEATVHEDLSEIAPTVQLKTSESDSWESAQRMAGEATGEEAAAARAIEATRRDLGSQAERLAAYSDLTVAVAFQSLDQLVVIPGTDIGGRIVAELGMRVMDTPDGKTGQYSLEQTADLLGSADVIVSFDYGSVDPQENNPLFRGLPAVQAGRYVTVSSDVATACYQESSLSLRWAAEPVADALVVAAEGRGTRLD